MIARHFAITIALNLLLLQNTAQCQTYDKSEILKNIGHFIDTREYYLDVHIVTQLKKLLLDDRITTLDQLKDQGLKVGLDITKILGLDFGGTDASRYYKEWKSTVLKSPDASYDGGVTLKIVTKN